MQSSCKYIRRIRNLGFANFLRYTWHQKTKLPARGEFVLRSKICDFPLLCRARTSDIDVFKHMFVVKEYACLDFLESPKLIVDCGANAGFSSACLLSLFPDARLLAIEPDHGNFQMLCRNTQAFGARCKPINAGVWHKDCALKFSEQPFGDGREWAISVRQAKDGESADIKGLSMKSLFSLLAGEQRIDLLKIDIEGSERGLFSAECQDWLARVDTIIIELHGEECTRIYREQVDRAGFSSKVVGGLMLSTRS